jgi:hypothetical protein
MGFDRKAPAAALGLFLYLCIPLFCAAAEDAAGENALAGKAGSLWLERDAGSWYWQNGFSHNPERGFVFGVDLGGIHSDLAAAALDAMALGYSAGFKAENLGLMVSTGFFWHSRLESQIGDYSFYNEGGSGSFFRASAPLRLGEFSLEPSFLYARSRWEAGDFYLFLGKPAIPAAYSLGLSAAYGEQHRLDFFGLSLDLDILSNEEEGIFDGDLRGLTAAYSLSLEGPQTRFSGALGWASLLGRLEGALDLSNQHSFPVLFRFFRLQGGVEAHLAYGLLSFVYKPGLFQIRLDAGAAQVLGGEAGGNLHYEKTAILGAEEAAADLGPLGLGGTGAAFFLLDAGLRLGRNRRFSLGLQKAFFAPWGYERFLPPSGGGTGAPSAPSADFLQSLLLSGLSLYGVLVF